MNKHIYFKYPSVFLICITILVLFIKNIYFHAITFGEFPVFDTGMGLTIFKFYLAKLLCPVFISFILLITYRRIWIIACMALIDILCIANVIYFKSYDMFLTINSVTLVGNMDGAWSSLEAYMDARLLLFPFLTAIWFVILYKIPLPHARDFKALIYGMLCLFIVTYLNNILVYDYTDACGITNLSNRSEDNKFTFKSYCRIPFMGIAMQRVDNRKYVYEQSILSYFPSSIMSFCKQKYKGVPALTSNDLKLLEALTPYGGGKMEYLPSNPSKSTIIILVESLESWVIRSNIDGMEVTPFLNKFICQDHILYCDKIKSQALAGNSGDGQMIVNTGLLPIANGVACMEYDYNIYPNIAGLYSESFTINPWPHIWNQATMCKRYGYRDLIEPQDKEENWQDKDILMAGNEMINSVKSKFCLMDITVSTHTPFNRIQHSFPVSNQTPDLLRKYMACVNYTDKCIEEFIMSLSDSMRNNTTIVITGDHTIFKPAMLHDYKEYATKQNLSIASGESFCPLIVCDSQIEGNIYVSDTCYQMDIFPTIMHLIGCEDYYWKGFGVNLLDSVARHNRPITEQEAYELSDKLIRSNYFATIDK